MQLYMRCVVTKDVSASGSANVRPYLSLHGKLTEAPLSPAMRLLQLAEQVAREVVTTRAGLALVDVELVHLPSGPVVVVSIESAREPSAEDVGRFERVLRERLVDPSVRVVVRRTASTDVTAKGHILFGEAHFGAASPADQERRAAVEAAVRSHIEARPNLFAAAVDAVHRDGGWIVRAEVVGPRVPTPAEVRGVEQASAAALGEPVTLSVWARTELQVTGERYAPLRDRSAGGDAALPEAVP